MVATSDRAATCRSFDCWKGLARRWIAHGPPQLRSVTHCGSLRLRVDSLDHPGGDPDRVNRGRNHRYRMPLAVRACTRLRPSWLLVRTGKRHPKTNVASRHPDGSRLRQHSSNCGTTPCQERRPPLHEGPPPLEQVRAPVGRLELVMFTWASATSHASRGASEHSAAQSRKLERNPWGNRPDVEYSLRPLDGESRTPVTSPSHPSRWRLRRRSPPSVAP